jgi:hypothetical protein
MDVNALGSLTERGQSSQVGESWRPPILLARGADPLRGYRRRTRRSGALRRYQQDRWALQWLLERGPVGIDL